MSNDTPEKPAAEALADRLMAGRGRLRGPFATPTWEPEIGEIWTRAYTLEQENKVAHLIEKNDSRGYAEIVVRNARDRDGILIFQLAHRVALSRGAEGEDVKNAALWIMGRLDDAGEQLEAPTVEDAAGN